MENIENLSYQEIQSLKQPLRDLEKTKTRSYDVRLRVNFQAIRPESDLDDLSSFVDGLIDYVHQSYGLMLPERVDILEAEES